MAHFVCMDKLHRDVSSQYISLLPQPLRAGLGNVALALFSSAALSHREQLPCRQGVTFQAQLSKQLHLFMGCIFSRILLAFSCFNATSLTLLGHENGVHVTCQERYVVLISSECRVFKKRKTSKPDDDSCVTERHIKDCLCILLHISNTQLFYSMHSPCSY